MAAARRWLAISERNEAFGPGKPVERNARLLAHRAAAPISADEIPADMPRDALHTGIEAQQTRATPHLAPFIEITGENLLFDSLAESYRFVVWHLHSYDSVVLSS